MTTSSSSNSLSLMPTTSNAYWTLQPMALTLASMLLLMPSLKPMRILPRVNSCSSSMAQVEQGRLLFTIPTAKAQLAGHIVVFVAGSGIASQLPLNGSTAHSMFKIPIPCHEDSTCGVRKQSPLAALFRAARMIVWDEVSMSHRNVFQAVDRMLMDIRDSPQPFGGLTVVFGGDFQQTLPIIRGGSHEQIIHACLTRSPIFHKTKVFFLTQNMHLSNTQDPAVAQFAQFHPDLVSGKNFPADGNVSMPRDLYLHGATIQPLIQHIYPTIQSNPHPAPAYFINHMLLAPRNEDVHVINHKIIDMFHASPTETRVYQDRKSTRLNSSHQIISYAVFCLKKKKKNQTTIRINKKQR